MDPRARRDNLEIQKMGEEMVIYDLRSNRAHALDPFAVQVWELADGSRNVAELAQVLRERSTEVTVDDVQATLQILGDAGLVEGVVTRRDVLRRAAMVGAVSLVGAGMLKSIIAPEPIAALSCDPGAPPGDPAACSGL